MKVLVQRVKEASVSVEGRIVGKIGSGILALLGIHKDDRQEHIQWYVDKVLNLRLFSDTNDKMNLSLMDVKGELLVVSQFTLYGKCKNGRRPDFMESAHSSYALPIYQQFLQGLKKDLPNVQAGIFGASMQVQSINDGPITLMIEK
ncbi:D-tyrosyl-tRNA(Tyr) deacylase [Chlamydiales bacterium STE3]|nr:D-tyrosyl-tRNA(Tyr) deacylase [Chlamydiales bacterium STE3]